MVKTLYFWKAYEDNFPEWSGSGTRREKKKLTANIVFILLVKMYKLLFFLTFFFVKENDK